MTLSDSGFLDIDAERLEYRMIGSRPDAAPTIVMLHEGLGCVGLWGDFPDKLQAATGAGVFVYSRAGSGKSRPFNLPRLTRARRDLRPPASGAGACSATATAPRSRPSMPAATRIIASAAWC